MSVRRVLYVSPNAELGGAEQVLQLLVKGHDRERYEPIVFFLKDGSVAERLRKWGVSVIISREVPRLRHLTSISRVVLQIKELIVRKNIEIVHSVMSYGHIFGGAAAKLAGVKSTWFQHGPCGPLDWVSSRIPTDVLFVNSKFTEVENARTYPSTKRTVLCFPGIETELLAGETLHEEALKMRRAWSLESSHLAFGLVGRLSAMKGHQTFLEAASRIALEQPNARFVIIGGAFMPADHEYEREMKSLSERLGLSRQVIWVGPVSYPQYSSLAALDVIVNATPHAEPFGLTIAEGMMLKKPVIAPRAGGPLEMIDDGVDGIHFIPGSSEDLADKMRILAEDPPLRSALGIKANLKALEKFSILSMLKTVESAYDQVFSGIQR